MFEKYRIKWALRQGKREHKFGRIIATPIVISLLYNYFITKDMINVIISGFIFMFWLTYLISHTLEKKLYGNRGFR